MLFYREDVSSFQHLLDLSIRRNEVVFGAFTIARGKANARFIILEMKTPGGIYSRGVSVLLGAREFVAVYISSFPFVLRRTSVESNDLTRLMVISRLDLSLICSVCFTCLFSVYVRNTSSY